MPNKIIEFSSIDEAIYILKKFSDNFEYPAKSLSEEEVIKKSVSSNIFRAFRNLNIRPSIIYREWASDNLHYILDDLKEITSQDDYYEFINKHTDSLLDKWAETVESPNDYLIYGPASKMINLLVKTLHETDEFFHEEQIEFLQVPFDQFSLQPLKYIINDLTELSYKINIPSSPTMKFINTPQLYRIMMDAVYRLCDYAEIVPIVFDYWCWNDKH